MCADLNLQHNYLEEAKKEDVAVTLFLKNGVQINGYIEGYDDYSITLKSDGEQKMIMKKGITTIVPEEKVDNYFPEEF